MSELTDTIEVGMSPLAHQRRHRARTPVGLTPFPALPAGTSAVIVDLGSVLIDIADIHAAAW